MSIRSTPPILALPRTGSEWTEYMVSGEQIVPFTKSISTSGP
jgi:hypothetical protein